MIGAFNGLVRRGIEAQQHVFVTKLHVGSSTGPDDDAVHLPYWGLALMISTVVLAAIKIFQIRYSYGNLIATLTMIESPTAPYAYEVVNEDPDAPLDEKKETEIAEPELLLVKQQPLTANPRKALQYLRSQAGCSSAFRGLSAYIALKFATRIVRATLGVMMFPFATDYVLALVIISPISVAWTHIMISEPNGKNLFQRLPGFKVYKKIALPTALVGLTQVLSIYLPLYLANAYHLEDMTPQSVHEMSACAKKVLVLKWFSVIAVALGVSLLVLIPATVTLKRVEASLLPEETETVVPFDRSFNGKFVAESAGGSGVVGILDAWSTFGWGSRIRLLKLYAKVGAVQFLITISAAVLLMLEFRFALGSDFDKLMATYQQANVESEEVHILPVN